VNQTMLTTAGYVVDGWRRNVIERTVSMSMGCYQCQLPTAWKNEKIILAYCFDHHPNNGVDEEAATKWRSQLRSVGNTAGRDNKGGIKVVRNEKHIMGRN